MVQIIDHEGSDRIWRQSMKTPILSDQSKRKKAESYRQSSTQRKEDVDPQADDKTSTKKTEQKKNPLLKEKHVWRG